MQYIIQHNNAAVAVHDRDLNYVYVSDSYMEQFRIKDQYIIGKHHYEVFPDLPQKWREVHQKALKGEASSHSRDPFKRADGTVDITRWECIPWYKNKNDIGGIIIYTEVINDQIKIEKELEETRDNLLLLMENLPIGVAVHSVAPEVKFSYMNDKFPNILKTTKSTLMQGHLLKTIDKDESFKKDLIDSMKNHERATLKWIDLPVYDGEKTAYVSLFSTGDFSGNQRITTAIDVTDQKLRESEIKAMSYQDFVTGIPNRQYFSDRFNAFDKEQLYPIGLLVIDVNGLKLVNDAFGFEVGTKLLKQVATVLKDIAQDEEVFARIGGDEFGLLVPCTSKVDLESLKTKIYEAINTINFDKIEFSVTIGMALKEDQKGTVGSIYKIAEDDMFKHKVLESQSNRSKAIHAVLATLTDKHHVEKVHSERVGEISYQIGKAMKLNEESLQELKMAGKLHDIGKIATPDKILGKPGKLNRQEWTIMKEHPLHGYNILRAADEYSALATYALTHHERYDGKGYSKGLKGKDIPLFSRIIAVADAFEAMTSNRPYRDGMKFDEALNEMKKHKGKQFDPDIFDVFLLEVIDQIV